MINPAGPVLFLPARVSRPVWCRLVFAFIGVAMLELPTERTCETLSAWSAAS